MKAGATTVWEDWEGEASLNHYSPGAVCQWLFDTVAGIEVAGENRFTFAPVPGGTLTHAAASYVSPYGPVASRWEQTADEIEYTISVPSNTTAEVRLPGFPPVEVGPGEHVFRGGTRFDAASDVVHAS